MKKETLLQILKENNCTPFEAFDLLKQYMKTNASSEVAIGQRGAAFLTAEKKEIDKEMFYEFIWLPIRKKGHKKLDEILEIASKNKDDKQYKLINNKKSGNIKFTIYLPEEYKLKIDDCENNDDIKPHTSQRCYSTLRKWHTEFNKKYAG